MKDMLRYGRYEPEAMRVGQISRYEVCEDGKTLDSEDGLYTASKLRSKITKGRKRGKEYIVTSRGQVMYVTRLR